METTSTLDKQKAIELLERALEAVRKYDDPNQAITNFAAKTLLN